jgi:protein CWC15
MTTAHRPTWKAAIGQASTGGWTAGGAKSSAKAVLSLPSHTQLKVRKGSQLVDRQQALKESLLKLEQAEKKAPVVSKRRPISQALEEEGRLKLLQQTEEIDDAAIAQKYNDDDADDDDDDGSGAAAWRDVDHHAEGESEDDLDASSDEDDDEDSDDEDDEAALQAELAKIKAEREAAKQKQAEEEAKREESKLEEAALLGNPLLAGGGDDMTGKLKRKWNDDVVFRNQAKGEPGVKKRFINDTIRNDFHKRFLNKFIR